MNRRLLFLLSAGVALAVVAVGIGVFLVLQYQANVSQVPQGRWVRVPTAGPGQPTPTVPANGFVFKDASGASVNYAPPSATPAGFSWSIYHNDQDGYTIEYPQTWTRVDTSSEGHSGLALYPLGTDLHVDVPGGPKGIGMGWVSTFHAPLPTDPTVANLKAITINGVAGQLYTQGGLGQSLVAAFPRQGGYVLLSGDADSDVLIYVFQHMLSSLTFR